MFDSSSESVTVLNILASAGTESPIKAARVVRILGLLLIQMWIYQTSGLSNERNANGANDANCENRGNRLSFPN